jgi:hypothetical protein
MVRGNENMILMFIEGRGIFLKRWIVKNNCSMDDNQIIIFTNTCSTVMICVLVRGTD